MDRNGFWTARTADIETVTGVSLADPGESDLRPRWLPPEPSNRTGPIDSRPGSSPARTGLSALLAAAALIVLVFEWFLQTRYWRGG